MLPTYGNYYMYLPHTYLGTVRYLKTFRSNSVALATYMCLTYLQLYLYPFFFSFHVNKRSEPAMCAFA